MRLKYQLFLTLLAASAVLIALMYVISSWSFSRGFLEYVNQRVVDHLTPVAERLVEQYEADGDWQGDEVKLLMQNVNDASRSEGVGFNIRPPRDRSDRKKHRASREERQNGTSSNDRLRRLAPPITLTDANKIVIVGGAKINARVQWLPLESEAGLIGYLAFPKPTRINRHFDQVFENKQKKIFGLTALAMILISGILSIPLASRIVKPLLTVNKAVSEISGGNYAHRAHIIRRDEIGDLAKNINLLGVSLEQNRNARQRWIAEISHELRTPLAVLRGEIEAVQDGVRVLNKPAIDSLHGEVLSLGRLIDDLHTLSVSDVGALDYQMEPLDLGKLLTGFLESHEAALASKSLTIKRASVPANSFVLGDAQRLEQLLANLMQNTCRYTDPGGELHVSINQAQSNNRDELVIDWQDSSPGVSADALPKLFDPLYRAETSRSREFGGTGLGLSIAKRIVEAHQGEITVQLSTLGGLHIQIQLPMAAKSI